MLMAKGKTATVFFCGECGYESSKWMGQCPACKAWNTFVEETVKKPSGVGAVKSAVSSRQEPAVLSSITLKEDERVLTHIGELDRVLGGGIVPGSLVLVGGDPGIGKSTLLLQVCKHLSDDHRKVVKEAKGIVRGEHQQSKTNVSFFIVSDGKNDTKYSLHGLNKRFNIEKY